MNPQQQQKNTGLIEAEIQHNIPVKSHIADELKNPIAAIKQLVDHDKKDDDHHLDQVLKDVNKSVKDSDKMQTKKSIFSFRKKPSPARPQQSEKPAKTPEVKRPKLMLSVVIAVLVAAGLSVSAFYAFNHPSNTLSSKRGALTSGTTNNSNPNQTSNNEQLSSSDIKSFSTDLQSKVDSLNDGQEFNTDDLSDKHLGL